MNGRLTSAYDLAPTQQNKCPGGYYAISNAAVVRLYNRVDQVTLPPRTTFEAVFLEKKGEGANAERCVYGLLSSWKDLVFPAIFVVCVQLSLEGNSARKFVPGVGCYLGWGVLYQGARARSSSWFSLGAGSCVRRSGRILFADRRLPLLMGGHTDDYQIQ